MESSLSGVGFLACELTDFLPSVGDVPLGDSLTFVPISESCVLYLLGLEISLLTSKSSVSIIPFDSIIFPRSCKAWAVFLEDLPAASS